MTRTPFNSFLIRPLVFIAIMYGLLRLSLLFIYPEYFAGLSIGEILIAFAQGMRFDFSIAAITYSFSLLGLLVLQFLPKAYPRGSAAMLWFAFIVLSATWLLYAGSIGYFGEVHRHLGAELVQLSADMKFVLTLLTGSRIWALAAGMIFLVGAAFLWRVWVVLPASRLNLAQPWLVKVCIALLLVAMEVLLVRGFELSSKPLGVADAYALGNERQATLSLNGAFSALHLSRKALKARSKPIAYFQVEELQAMQPQLPIFRRIIPHYELPAAYERPNLVMVLLESWSFKYIDGLAGGHYGATPFMDSLIAKSAVWTNAYAAGQRSIEGIQAALTSVPLLEGWPTIGFGLEQTRITSIAEKAEEQGYETLFMQTSKARSFHVDSIAKGLGFNHYYAMEDYEDNAEYEDESEFGWDYEGLQFFAEKLSVQKPEKPYFAFFFTGTTHEPFPNPGEQFHIRPHDEHWEHRYLNTLRYSDHSLEKFMHEMKETTGYQNTIFIFVADHTLRASLGDRKDSFRIPLIIYSPSELIPPGLHSDYVSQYDIMPTLSSLMGVSSEISSFGRSLLTEPEPTFAGALGKQGSIGVWLTSQGWISFNGENGQPLESSKNIDFFSSALHWNKLRLQQADRQLRNNLWVAPRPELVQVD